MADAPLQSESSHTDSSVQGSSLDTATGKEAPAELSTQRVKGIFSAIAPRYDLFNTVSSMGTHWFWLNRLCLLTPTTHESAVLDVAGGTGEVTFALARRNHPKSILCTDLVPEMLEVAEKTLASHPIKGVEIDFEVADAQALPFEDASFDIVTMAYGLRNMPEREKALDEIFRVLKPGGVLTCLDFSTPPNRAWNAIYSLYRENMLPFWGKLITGDGEGFVYLSDSIAAFPTQRPLAEKMLDAGFSRVIWENQMGGIACIHVAFKPGTGAITSLEED